MRLAVLWAAAMAAAPAGATQICDLSDTPQTCWSKVEQRQPPLAAARQQAHDGLQHAQAARLAAAETGVDAAGLASALHNFLPLLNLTGLSGAASGLGRGNPIAASANLPLPAALRSGLGAVAETPSGTPEVMPLLRQQLARAGETGLLDELTAKLDAADDYALGATYDFRFAGFGRNFSDYSAHLTSLWLQATAEVSAPRQAVGRADFAVANLGRRYKPCRPAGKAEYRFDELSCPPGFDQTTEQVRREFLAAVEEEAAAAARYERSLNDAAARHGLDRFEELVGNQAQLHLSYRRLFRDPVVGAEASSVRATFEYGGSGLDDFTDSDAGRPCTEGGTWNSPSRPAGPACLRAYRDYIAQHEVALQRATRWSAYLEYTRIRDLAIDLPAVDQSLRVPGAERYSAGLAWGRYLHVFGGAPRATRIDVFGRYDALRNDLLRNDTWLAGVTLTQKLAGVSIPLALVFRGKSEFEVGPSDDLAAGLRVDFDWFGFGGAPSLELPALPPPPEPGIVPVTPLRAPQ